MQKIKSNHDLMDMQNEKNRKIVRIIQHKCPDSAIGAKHKVIITRFMNAIWTWW
jgi:hypothetical protein